MTSATATAALGQELPEHLRFTENSSENIVDVVDDKKYRAVFFAGDTLTLQYKQAKMYRMGGKLFPNCKTVPENFVSRCAITPLHDGMHSINKQLIKPEERPNYIQAYKKRNVLLNPATGERGDVIIGKSPGTKHLIFKKVYPIQEIGEIAYRNDGVVEMTMFSNAKEVIEAQFHYFPDWSRIVKGAVQLPKRKVELVDFINNRMAQAKSRSLIAVGEAMIQSCDQLEIWGKEYVDKQTMAIEDSKTVKGYTFRYDEISERLFVFLDITRRDSFVEDFARNAADLSRQAQSSGGGLNPDVQEAIKTLATAVTSMSQILATQQGIQIGSTKPEESKPPVDNGMDAEQHLEEALRVDDPGELIEEENIVVDQEVKAVASDEIDLDDEEEDDNAPLTDEELRLGHCGSVNSKSEPCQGKVEKRIGGTLYCKYHGPKPAEEELPEV